MEEEDGMLITADYDIAEKLSNHYAKMFSKPMEHKNVTNPHILFNSVEHSDEKITDFDFTNKDIEDAIGDLCTTSSADLDGMPAILLKNCRKELAPSIYTIWRKSFDQGTVPELMKRDIIAHIHKGGSRGDPAKYRTVTNVFHNKKFLKKLSGNI